MSVCTVAANYARTIALLDDYMASRPAAERDAVMGGNAAEAHPCGFKWAIEAKAKNNARLVVVDGGLAILQPRRAALHMGHLALVPAAAAAQ